jgi:hypothetical protein
MIIKRKKQSCCAEFSCLEARIWFGKFLMRAILLGG